MLHLLLLHAVHWFRCVGSDIDKDGSIGAGVEVMKI